VRDALERESILTNRSFFMFWLDRFLTYGWQWWVIFFGRKYTFGGLKAYLRATDHTSSNIISRDWYVQKHISYLVRPYGCNTTRTNCVYKIKKSKHVDKKVGTDQRQMSIQYDSLMEL
jgi:hypothetical protein